MRTARTDQPDSQGAKEERWRLANAAMDHANSISPWDEETAMEIANAEVHAYRREQREQRERQGG